MYARVEARGQGRVTEAEVFAAPSLALRTLTHTHHGSVEVTPGLVLGHQHRPDSWQVRKDRELLGAGHKVSSAATCPDAG